MANHRVPRGETSTYKGHGGKETVGDYQGKHRAEDGVKGYKMGSEKRRDADRKGDYERGK